MSTVPTTDEVPILSTVAIPFLSCLFAHRQHLPFDLKGHAFHLDLNRSLDVDRYALDQREIEHVSDELRELWRKISRGAVVIAETLADLLVAVGFDFPVCGGVRVRYRHFDLSRQNRALKKFISFLPLKS